MEPLTKSGATELVKQLTSCIPSPDASKRTIEGADHLVTTLTVCALPTTVAA